MGEGLILTHPKKNDPGRKAFDYYPTPSWVTHLLLKHYPPPTEWIVEPSAGDGAICRVLKKEMPEKKVYGIEIQKKFEDDLKFTTDEFVIGDFFEVSKDLRGKNFSIVANPPFSLAQKFIQACIDARAVYMAFLLRIDFLGSKERAAFHNANPLTQLIVLGKRPSFTGTGTDSYNYAWFVYDKRWVNGKQGVPCKPPIVVLP